MEIMKRKRTKRPRQPLALTIASTSSNVTENTTTNSGGSTSAVFTTSTEEEEDMANCLILLAHSRVLASPLPPATATCHTYYQCKTCDRYFSSFQALGGHRASHKKPKLADCEEKKRFSITVAEDGLKDTELSLGVQTKLKVHECSICGAEFSSGQALGGHMRRHRPIPVANCNIEIKKSRNVVALDLNLPAPEDDDTESRFGFGQKQQLIVFSAPSLVDCHY